MRAFWHAGLLLAPIAAALVLPPAVNTDVEVVGVDIVDSAVPQIAQEDAVSTAWPEVPQTHNKEEDFETVTIDVEFEQREPTLAEVYDELHFLKHQMKELKWQIREKKHLIHQLSGESHPPTMSECDSIKCVSSALLHKVKGFAYHVTGRKHGRHGHHEHPHHRDGEHGHHRGHHDKGPGHHMKHNGSHPFPHHPKGNHSHPHPPHRRPHHRLPICRFPPPFHHGPPSHHGPPHHGPPPPHHGPPHHGPPPPHHGSPPPPDHGNPPPPPHHGGPPPPPPHRHDGPDSHEPGHNPPGDHEHPPHDNPQHGPHEPHGPPHKNPEDHEGGPPHHPDHGPSPFANEHDNFDGPPGPYGPPPFIRFLDSIKFFVVGAILLALIHTIYKRCCCTRRSKLAKAYRRERREERLRRRQSRKEARKHAWREWARDLIGGDASPRSNDESGDEEEKNAMVTDNDQEYPNNMTSAHPTTAHFNDHQTYLRQLLLLEAQNTQRLQSYAHAQSQGLHLHDATACYPPSRTSFETQLPDYETDEMRVESLVGDGRRPDAYSASMGSAGSVRDIIVDKKDALGNVEG